MEVLPSKTPNKFVPTLEDLSYDIFLAYQHNEVDKEKRSAIINFILSRFKDKKVFCSEPWSEFFSESGMSGEDIYKTCLEAQAKSKISIFLIVDKRKSNAMIDELKSAVKLGQEIKLIIDKIFLDLDWVQIFIENIPKKNIEVL